MTIELKKNKGYWHAIDGVPATTLATQYDEWHPDLLIGLEDYGKFDPLSRSFDKNFYSARRKYLLSLSDKELDTLNNIDKYDRIRFIGENIASEICLEHQRKLSLIAMTEKKQIQTERKQYTNYYLDD